MGIIWAEGTADTKTLSCDHSYQVPGTEKEESVAGVNGAKEKKPEDEVRRW